MYGLQNSWHHLSEWPLKCSLSTTMVMDAVLPGVAVKHFLSLWVAYFLNDRHHCSIIVANALCMKHRNVHVHVSMIVSLIHISE